ncbi:MAG: hypothetical protein LBI42_03870 [Chitinispirillales bacterium]|jgi:hypothetical protein|nr:hypothetical protein [Chitinispirillales bacterium]
MLKKLCFMMTAAFVASGIIGCSRTLKDNTLYWGFASAPDAHTRVVWLDSDYKRVDAMEADLEVGEKKVMGQAEGKRTQKGSLERQAFFEALKSAKSSQEPADVLVAANYFYKTHKADMTVTVVGYPARYTNIRPKNADNINNGNAVTQSKESAAAPAPVPIESAEEEEEGAE